MKVKSDTTRLAAQGRRLALPDARIGFRQNLRGTSRQAFKDA
jgi:hypothetical protein